MKTLIVIGVDNHIDLITNSSSELFVLKGEKIEAVKEMLSEKYPDYLKEYEEVVSIDELTNDNLDSFLIYHCSSHMYPHRKEDLPLLKGFTFDELYEAERDYSTNGPKISWNGEIQYELRNNLPMSTTEKYSPRGFVTDENRERVINAIKETVGEYFLYSSDENPNWEMQEKLMEIGTRYHLG